MWREIRAVSLAIGILAVSILLSGMRLAQAAPRARPQPLHVVLTANPLSVAPRQKTTLEVKVTSNGVPLPGAEVRLQAGGGAFGSSGKLTSTVQTTGKTGSCSDSWSYPNQDFAPGGYGLQATVAKKGYVEQTVEVVVKIVLKAK
jgi:hypothetical protein